MRLFSNRLFIFLSLVTMVVGCGHDLRDVRQADLPESLPNRMVPVDHKVENATVPRRVKEGVPSKNSANPEEVDLRSIKKPVPVTDTLKELTVEPSLLNKFILSDTALMLSLLDDISYNRYQNKWVGSIYPACNFFLITALCESGYCEKSKPFFKAGDFDIYLMAAGFVKMKLDEVKDLFRANEKFDLVFQKQNPVAGKAGHIMVGVGYNLATNKIRIAQGNLGLVTHETAEVSDSYLLNWQGGFSIFVRR